MKLSKTSVLLISEVCALTEDAVLSLDDAAQASCLDKVVIQLSSQLKLHEAINSQNSKLINLLNSASPTELSKYLADYRRALQSSGELYEQVDRVFNKETLFALKPAVRKAVCSTLLLIYSEAHFSPEPLWTKIVAFGGQMFSSDL
jgi:hypothetical protein